MIRHNKKLIKLIVQYGILIFSIIFLGHKLSQVTHWEAIGEAIGNMGFVEGVYISLVVCLMPLNWTLEVIKWQSIVSHSCPLSFKKAFLSVISGLHTGYITPNRVGEFAGRIAFLPAASRWTGAVLNIINGLTLNIIITSIGLIVSFYYFRIYQPNSNFIAFGVVFLFILSCTILSLVALAPFTKRHNRNNIKFKWIGENGKRVIETLIRFKRQTIWRILLLSALRYTLFCVQYYLMLLFFGVKLSWIEGIIAIPTMYLLITYTPSFVFSEPIVRSGYAVLILGVFTENEIGIILTSVMVWVINFVIPLLLGGIILFYENHRSFFQKNSENLY